MNAWSRRALGALVLVIALAILPWVLPGQFYVEITSQILIFSLLALSLDILIGHGGMISLGQAVYLGVPAYAYIWLSAVAGTFAAVVGALIIGAGLAAFFRGALASRPGPWIPHDHIGFGPGGLGPRLSLGRAYRRR